MQNKANLALVCVIYRQYCLNRWGKGKCEACSMDEHLRIQRYQVKQVRKNIYGI